MTDATPTSDLDVRGHIGRRLKLARENAGISRRDLARRVGTTADRLAGYERGTHRLTARRLFEIASILEKPVSYFFDDLPEEIGDARRAQFGNGDAAERLRETMALINAFYRIRDADMRRDVIRLLRGIASDL